MSLGFELLDSRDDGFPRVSGDEPRQPMGEPAMERVFPA